MLLYFLQGVTLALPATIVPSPFKVFIISEALQNGWRRVLPVSLAPLVTDGPIIVLVLVVLSQTPDWFLDSLRVLGGLFILYLASRIFAMLRAEGPALEASEQTTRQSFFKAIIINFLNPNPYLLWGVVAGPIVLTGWQQSAGLGLSFIAGFYATFVLGLAALIIIFATAGKLDPRVNKILSVVTGVALVIFGLLQIVTGVTALVG